MAESIYKVHIHMSNGTVEQVVSSEDIESVVEEARRSGHRVNVWHDWADWKVSSIFDEDERLVDIAESWHHTGQAESRRASMIARGLDPDQEVIIQQPVDK